MAQSDLDSAGPPSGYLARTATALSGLTMSLGGNEFGTQLLGFLRSQNDFDSAMVLAYHPRRRPVLLEEALEHPLRRNSAAVYLGGAYLLDPVFARATSVKAPQVVRLSDIVPGDFLDSEYMRSYYKDSNIVDEINYLVPGLRRRVFAVCLERSRSRSRFDDHALRRFQDWLPLIASVFRQHERLSDAELCTRGDGEVDPEHDRLQALLSGFGRAQLTRREHQIAQLMLRGRSTPRIASELRVSAQTVRVHRRNIYDKLDISSLGELFTLAMNTLVGQQSTGARTSAR